MSMHLQNYVSLNTNLIKTIKWDLIAYCWIYKALYSDYFLTSVPKRASQQGYNQKNLVLQGTLYCCSTINAIQSYA